jgi:hypothetical protein
MNLTFSLDNCLELSTDGFGNLPRRELLLRAGAGFGAIPLSWLLQSTLSAAESDNSSPASAHSAKVPHRFGRAKSVIFLYFMEGGPSHIDTFDPKPKLNEVAGQKLPPSFKPVILSMGVVDAPLFAESFGE